MSRSIKLLKLTGPNVVSASDKTTIFHDEAHIGRDAAQTIEVIRQSIMGVEFGPMCSGKTKVAPTPLLTFPPGRRFRKRKFTSLKKGSLK